MSTAVKWSKRFLDADLAGAVGDRRFRYVPFHELTYSDQEKVRHAYVHSSGGMYNFHAEHYYYPINKKGHLPAARARRFLAIPNKLITDRKFMQSIGYSSPNPGWTGAGGPASPPTKKPTSAAVEFFYKHAGWSHGPDETPEQGHRRSAERLAKAEAYAEAHGWTVHWQEDPEEYQLGDAETEPPREVLTAVLKDRSGKVLESLGGIGDPDKNYARVVEAELALEAMPRSKR